MVLLICISSNNDSNFGDTVPPCLRLLELVYLLKIACLVHAHRSQAPLLRDPLQSS